ncbi:MAG TPA: tRNA lysidine(34) synthetase TilS, partial [Trueperaceae bacterium]
MLPERVLHTVAELAPKAKTFLVAVSGGSDSVALLRLLKGSAYRLEVAHFDHALREGSAADAEFVAELAASLSLPFHQERADVARIAADRGWNLEDGARRLRYAFLARTAKRVGADAILTGHTLDDQAETVLMQLLRGAAFLSGMPARRSSLIRPLLNIPHAELRAYLEELGQPYLRDPTNQDLS